MRIRLSILLAASAMLSGLYAQKSKDNPADWPMYTRDLAGTRYSPLKQINGTNVSKLSQAWRYSLRAAPTARALLRESRSTIHAEGSSCAAPHSP